MLIVTGANGTLGKLVVERLLARIPASQLGVSVREPQQAQALAERGVRVRRGDFEEPASLPHAFEGAAQILIISASATGEVAYRRHQAAIGAAVAAGAKRILYTSHMGASPTSRFAPMRAHAQSEQLLAACGEEQVREQLRALRGHVLRQLRAIGVVRHDHARDRDAGQLARDAREVSEILRDAGGQRR
jgi:uncharacterized protein YbjT (DUF2867 family)